jgi:hypothetical protein
MHLDQFLEQRIVDDEQHARAAMERLPAEDSRLMETGHSRVSATGWRVLAEAALKREMLFGHHDVPREDGHSLVIECAACQEPYPCQSLRITAAVYSDHPRYNPAWRPFNPDTRAD